MNKTLIINNQYYNISSNNFDISQIDNGYRYYGSYSNINNLNSYSDYLTNQLNSNIQYSQYTYEPIYGDEIESKKYLLLLHKDKNLSDIMEIYDLSEKDLQKLSIVKLKVRDYKINFLLKQD